MSIYNCPYISYPNLLCLNKILCFIFYTIYVNEGLIVFDQEKGMLVHLLISHTGRISEEVPHAGPCTYVSLQAV